MLGRRIILAESTVPSDDMETYAMQVLLHFSSYRSAEDLQINGSCVLRLREWAQTDQFDRTVRDTLNNIQNIRNAINLKREEDALDQQTLPYACTASEIAKRPKRQDKLHYDDTALQLIQNLVDESNNEMRDQSEISISRMRDQGKNNCGYKNIPKLIPHYMHSFYVNATRL